MNCLVNAGLSDRHHLASGFLLFASGCWLLPALRQLRGAAGFGNFRINAEVNE
jgi:hypothetical protein